ncbi:MAG: ArsR family transcriptional regulator [Candidatus Muproteobacteria bacterium RIFCSPHIGHO2_12_FULL_60_33]|uniref:ArsR family transcriptional regulator n=1 Tax=Candidatus Muproteobacteria bacterium RIFCSPLOWO2_01_FULL_60_18 TaxID=1817768 RepID=A0A1F6TZF7_9PROT|nr:MAG: ArsR family transcriptional regulator [Candidatus Muproteobacteria bacterium RIFCSPLOWO2_01_FULL_60_18]OGI52403.1 MAG: ArsR family transcriptional regulator [Candidatus Muproteobacteria bacterium RIFCSPHIGHO2_01_60_12]OGI54215.1 MAG: ArsR family transcriptional regulator [Candidatus Muproteobacteria bacterium RIFCSPHIGHO2_12_FULL_60_33]OGI55324.1 MAG: ArsR family transcriptional regulator [Candidatus Muproteobacteria bacterium RIFCSPHIGHO2_02_FULL_60_13]OGI59170.1 MAG: ArsR family trans
MSNLSFKKQLYAQIARLGKAVGSGHRLELLEYLAQGERTVEALARLSGLSVANTSQHLQILRQSGLVSTRREGLYVHYRLAESQVALLVEVLGKLAASQLAEVERLVQNYLTKKDEMEPVPRAELLTRVRDGIVTVLDVRPSDEYKAGHLPGAINIPLKELKEHLEMLPRQEDIVAYCRGPYCVLAYEAVAQLRQKGFKARRLEDGYPEWKLAGLPVEEDTKKR